MKRFLLLLFTVHCCYLSFCQNIEKVFLNKSDSTKNYYLAFKPTQEIKAFLFLIPGRFETPENVLSQTELPFDVSERGILTIIPVFRNGFASLGFDEITQNSLQQMIGHVLDRYKLSGNRFYIGGFSIGGAASLKYAELAVKHKYKHIPNAVFGIDPPLDFERYYNSSKRVLRLFHNKTPNNEPEMMMKDLEVLLGGPPDVKQKEYQRASPYSFSDIAQTNIRYLVNMPILIFSEPDVRWSLENRGYDVSHMNIRDQSGLINELHLLGNFKAVLITTNGKGFRKPDNIRHPHSWSIADSQTLLDWLEAQ